MLQLPLASSSGDAIMGIVILAAVLAIRWLVRGELRDSAAEASQTTVDTSPLDASGELAKTQERHQPHRLGGDAP